MKKKVIIAFSILATVIILTILGYNTVKAYYTHEDKITNKFKVGELEISVTEPNYEDNKVINPGDEITKDPTFSNVGEVDSYIRAQIYVPISKDIKYVDENENIVTPTEEIEIVSYEINDGWEEVTDDAFLGVYEDENGNKYNVYTYRYVQDGQEQIVSVGETIEQPIFSKVKVFNYLDIDKNTNIKLHVSAIAIQSEGGTSDEMWIYYVNQNGTGIVGV